MARRPYPPLPRWKERGVAVITALLLTTLAVAIVASLFWQQQVQVRSMENQRLHLQTKWILRGALDWATLVLDTFRGQSYTSLDQAWATPLAETRLDQYIERERVAGETFDATLSGSVMDACSRYNLRNLANENGTGRDAENTEVFERLLRNLQLPQTLAGKTADYVVAALPVKPVPDGGDANNPTPTPTPTPKRSSTVTGKPIQLLQVDDLLSIPGYTPELVARLRPFVTVLPERAPVNVNTAPPEVLAALVNGMSLSEANTLVARRKQVPWRDINQFGAELNGKNLGPDTAGVNSSWFLVSSRIRLDRAALDAEALLQRGGGGTTVVWIRQD